MDHEAHHEMLGEVDRAAGLLDHLEDEGRQDVDLFGGAVASVRGYGEWLFHPGRR